MQELGNKIEIKTISDLLGMKFFIPAYQRGYRWNELQVKDLLNDIDNFTPKEIINSSEKTWYCLQPLVVKQKEEDVWEVIDGQQRLTTIFLILHYFNQGYVENRRKKLFDLNYETRKNSNVFLHKVNNESKENADLNIDYQHIFNAYQTITEWFREKGDQYNQNEFESKFQQYTKVIWYKTAPEQDAVEIFTRINMGKIPLTNAELIKALFLNNSNFKDDDSETIRLKQLEIATEWDNIEYALHNDEFWLFINQDKNDKETRIEFIFELIVGRSPKDDKDYLFREYNEKFNKNKEKAITENWKIIKRHFQIMQDWFDDRELYHKVGCLVTFGIEIRDLIKESFEKSKFDFITHIDWKIKDKLSNVQIEELEFGMKERVKMVLLLHNIQTMLNNEKENSRFPFNRYKRENWNIEHIHAIATEIPQAEQHQKDWLEQAKEFIDKKETELINRIDNYSKDSFDQLFNDILNYFDENKKHDDNNDDDLSNLVLLDEKTNKSYKNAVFPVKRKTIIEREKEGTFVPLCTKNVFMKYYSPKVGQMTFWGKSDREEYFKDIESVIDKYLPSQE